MNLSQGVCWMQMFYRGSHHSCPAFWMITLTLLHLLELNPPRYNTKRRCGQPRPRSRREKERECMLQAPGCRRRADPREQPCACSPMMMIDAGRTHTPQPLSKIKSLFCKVVKEQNGTELRQPPTPPPSSHRQGPV